MKKPYKTSDPLIRALHRYLDWLERRARHVDWLIRHAPIAEAQRVQRAKPKPKVIS